MCIPEDFAPTALTISFGVHFIVCNLVFFLLVVPRIAGMMSQERSERPFKKDVERAVYRVTRKNFRESYSAAMVFVLIAIWCLFGFLFVTVPVYVYLDAIVYVIC